MIQMGDWKTFFITQKVVILLFLVAMIGGIWYGVYAIREGIIGQEVVGTYFVGMDTTMGHVDSYFWQALSYLKKVLFVWIGGIYAQLMPVSIFLTCVYIFSYSCTCTIILATLQQKDNMLKVIFVFLCSVAMVSYLLLVVAEIVRKFKSGKVRIDRKYSILLVNGVIISLIMSFTQNSVF